MSDALLTILKLCFLALLYLFLFRVVRVTVLELRTPVVVSAPQVVATPERQPKGRYRLQFLEPASRQGELVALDDDMTLGRGGGCNLVLSDDTFVSQVHARLFIRDNKLWLEDLGSTNGTFHNGDRVTNAAVRLRRGDRIQLGQTVAEVLR